MRARMSDSSARSSYVFTGGDAHIYCAETEARSILADVETTHPERWTLYDSRGRHEGLNSAIYAERLALAESLRSFVEGN
jgi:hypothetical protein